MTVRTSARREVRLDAERDAKLDQTLEERGITFAAWVREQIDRDAEARARAERLAMVEKLFKMNIDWGFDEFPDADDQASALVRHVMNEVRDAAALDG